MPHRLRTDAPGFETRFRALLAMKREDAPDVDAAVAGIIADVRARGDAAVIDLTARFDRLELTPNARLSRRRDRGRMRQGRPRTRRGAGTRRRPHPRLSRPPDAGGRESWTDEAGATLGWRWSPVGGGALCAGRARLLPVLGPDERDPRAGRGRGAAGHLRCPTPDGKVNPLVLYAARLAGVETVYRIGGAQAIAAMAYGTETIAPVDKITGPGNAYVAAAKRRVFGQVGIDMIAGRPRSSSSPTRTTTPTGSRSTCCPRPNTTKARSRS
jgi:histidinol dehydrogenase